MTLGAARQDTEHDTAQNTAPEPVRAPAPPAAPEPTGGAAYRPAGSGDGRATVVVVDDTPDIRLLVSLALGRHPGFIVVGEAADGRAGVELVQRLRPDAVVLDIAMPTLDGLRTLPLLHEVSPNTAVIVLSAFGAEQMGAAALAAGAAAYVHKGTPLPEIVDIVVSCVGRDTGGPAGRVPGAVVARPLAPMATDGPPAHGSRAVGTETGRWLQLVDQAVPYGLAAVSVDGLLDTWNAAARRITGLAAADVLGRPWAAMLLSAGATADGLLRQAAAGARAVDTRWIVARDGTRRWVEFAVSALREGDGALGGYALELHDRTQDRRVEETQASLFAAVSHDLRTPVTAIRAFASLLADAKPSDRAMFAARIDANAEQLQRLINGLFDYAKVRAGAVPVRPEPLELRDLAARRVQDISSVLAGFDVRVTGDPVVALADAGALTRVLDNLLSNAAKYSPPGSPIVVHVEQVDGHARLAVRDRGRGIDPDDLPTIFGEFVRGRLAQDDGGTGLGLASVRHLVTQQDGRVWIDSELGAGTTVTVELPLPATAER